VISGAKVEYPSGLSHIVHLSNGGKCLSIHIGNIQGKILENK
jgi:hypothetical protein